MKTLKLSFLLAVLLSMVGAKSFASDIAVENDDGVTIYYNFINDGTELAVAYGSYQGSVVIPESVTYEGQLYNVTAIGNSAFYNCEKLTAVTIPNSVTAIGEDAFRYCKNLASVSIPTNVTTISTRAFSECESLKEISIPSNVTSIGQSAFAYCGFTSLTIPGNVKTIGLGAFSCLYSLTELTICEGVQTISSSFDSCTKLKEVTIPNSVTSIGFSIFRDCTALEKVTIGNGIKGLQGFSGCTSLKEINIPSSVTTLYNHVFQNCRSLTSIDIPSSVTKIEYAAFTGCSSLTSVNIPDGVTKIDNYTFQSCSKLTELKIPDGVTEIGNYAFSGCSSLKELIIPNKVTSIGDWAFSGCSGLTELIIPNKVTSISSYAFTGCSGLTELTIPEGVQYITEATFSGCTNLIKVTIPNSLQYIGQYAFRNCWGLTAITIPSGVTTIKESVFDGCKSLMTVVSLIAKPFNISSGNIIGVFKNIPEDATLYVPKGTKGDYQARGGWKDFADIKELGEPITVSLTIEDGLATYCPKIGLDFSNATKIAAYKASVSGNTVTLTKVDQVAMGEGVLLRSLNGGAATEELPTTIEAARSEDNVFVGTWSNIILAETEERNGTIVTNYVLSKKDDVVGFYKANNTNVAAGKAYLPIEVGSVGAAALSITFDDSETTGIDAALMSNEERTNKTFYNLNGQRVTKPANGLYIVDGNKVVIK